MIEKDLKKLHRNDLLELLLAQTKEVDRLKKELSDAQEALAKRDIILEESGSIAEAALKLNKVMETAQEAADQYLENIKARERRCQENCERIERESREKADQLLAEATEQAAMKTGRSKNTRSEENRTRRRSGKRKR